jgi:hypothetical protein
MEVDVRTLVVNQVLQDEFAGMTEADLIAETRRFEGEKRKLEQNVKRVANENKQLDARIKENQEKLKMSC